GSWSWHLMFGLHKDNRQLAGFPPAADVLLPCRRSTGGVGGLHPTVLRPAILARGGAGRALFAVAGHGLLAGGTAIGLQCGRHTVAAALAEAEVVVTAAALVGMAFKRDAGRRTVAQVLGVAGHCSLELRTHRLLVEIEIDGALAQARVGVQVLGTVGTRRGGRLGGGGGGRGGRSEERRVG